MDAQNEKFHKDILVNGIATRAYIDLGSSCTTITLAEAERLGLEYDIADRAMLRGYGGANVSALGSVTVEITVDQIREKVKTMVVPNGIQDTPMLIGRTFTEIPGLTLIKDDRALRFHRNLFEMLPFAEESTTSKIPIWVAQPAIVPPNHLGMVKVTAENFNGDLLIEAQLKTQEGYEYCVPRTIITINPECESTIPLINLSRNDIILNKEKIIGRAMPCVEAKAERVGFIGHSQESQNVLTKLRVGPIDEESKQKLIRLIGEYRGCFAETIGELGCAKSTQMDISLQKEAPFTHRPYRMALSEQREAENIVGELLAHDIIRESTSNYCSPVLLVTKKNGERRLCIDYRRLNSLTVKDNYPMPRIDDQVNRLQRGRYFTGLDLRSGYYQIPLSESAKHYTAFVTPTGLYEFNRVPFGLTNAPRIFQRYMNTILRPAGQYAAVYLDDVLLHARTTEEALGQLKNVFDIFEKEGLTLNLAKCFFLMSSISFLGYEIGNGHMRPGQEKTTAVANNPKTIHQVRQFLGLTGYFQHFVQGYASIAKPLTTLTKKNVPWRWEAEEEQAFQTLKNALTERPILALFDPELPVEVHCDASKLGVAGMLLQEHSDNHLHPVAYFSRQTTDSEQNFHSYELETLAVVDSLKKFRPYLLGGFFIVVTDCNSLKATHNKRHILPRIARWWLQLQEFNFDIKYRPGERMKHIDALSRNPDNTKQVHDGDTEATEVILHIEPADWILAGQLTDDKITAIQQVLAKPPVEESEKIIYKNYALRDGRVYRITARGLQWVVPRGMRHQVVRAAHDDLGHFGAEKTLQRLCEHYWFPRMRRYVDKYIACYISCLYNKRITGKREGYLHPPKITAEPIHTVHVDHLGPFPRSRKGNVYILAGIDAFTKFVFLQAVKSTRTKFVINYFKDIFATYGTPKVLISDRGSCFTARAFRNFCLQNKVQHVMNAVATPRANGQVERLNRVILGALKTGIDAEDRWDERVRDVQFAINNVVSKSTGKTPSQLFFGMRPRYGRDAHLIDEVSTVPRIIDDLLTVRRLSAEKNAREQERRKRDFDKRRKPPHMYKEGDLALVEQKPVATGVSRKLHAPYAGPVVVKKVLPNDRYVVERITNSGGERKRERIVAVDAMKPWCPTGGVSDETGSSSGDDAEALPPDSDTDPEDVGQSRKAEL